MTDTILHIDYAKAKELVAAAIAERGEDYTYEVNSCQNVWRKGEVLSVFGEDINNYKQIMETQPGCIIGMALHKAGISLDVLARHSTSKSTLSGLHDKGLATYTAKASRYLQEVQEGQDNHMTWGKADAAAQEWITSTEIDGADED